MRLSELDAVPCPVAQAAAVVGDAWTILILRDAFQGATRFDVFQRSTRASRAIVSDRLNRLVANGLMEKAPYEGKPQRYEYRLTAKGRALQPVFMTLAHWSETHLGRKARPLGRRHVACGRNFTPEVCCSECHEIVRPGEVAYDRIANPALVGI